MLLIFLLYTFKTLRFGGNFNCCQKFVNDIVNISGFKVLCDPHWLKIYKKQSCAILEKEQGKYVLKFV